MKESLETVGNTDQNGPIVSALIKVLGLFGIEKSNANIRILHQNSLDEEIGSLLDEYDNKIEEWKNNFIAVYFNFQKDKWSRDTHRFWCGFFERLGIGYYSGNNVIHLIKQIKSHRTSTKTTWHLKLFKCIRNQKYNSKSLSSENVVEMINNQDYTLSTVSHTGNRKVPDHQKLSYLITALRESILWGFESTKRFSFLIIDDRAYGYKPTKEKSKVANLNEDDSNDKIIIDIIKLIKIYKGIPINWYLLNGNGDSTFQNAFANLPDEKQSINKYLSKITLKNNGALFSVKKEHNLNKFTDFHFLLVDLYFADSQKMEGLELVSKLQHKNEEKTRRDVLTFEKPEKGKKGKKSKDCLIPEILAYTISDDVETIQMAQRMGAAGYVHKENPEGLALAIVRAGPPLALKDATRLDFLSSNNFPCITSLPRQITKHLFDSKISVPNADDRVEKTDDLVWIRSIPKADNHVHFGTAIPLEWCYILSLISLYHWNNHWVNQGKRSYKKYKEIITKTTECVSRIIEKTINLDSSIEGSEFRRKFLHFFSKEYNTAEVIFLKDVINYLVSISDDLLNDKQIACLINVLLGNLLYGNKGKKSWKGLYVTAKERVDDVKEIIEEVERIEKGEKSEKNIYLHNLMCFRDCKHLINNIELPRFHLFQKSILQLINIDYETDVTKIDFDPLSEMLSIGKADKPYGLECYLASTCLVGSSLLQFADTVLLASMSIPEWAAAKKAKKNNDTAKPSKRNHKEEVTDNVIHLELRTTPQGFLNPYDFEKSNGTLASKLICVGLEYGIKKLLKTPSPVTANLLISIKRDRDREDIIPCINTAVDLRDEYLNYIKDNKISEAKGFMIPHVSGLDVAGIERNNLPAELYPFYKEAFERCLLSTIHAGETESAQSVKDAIFMLNASRIGHGLSIQQDEELKRLIAERRICVELCPKSNQFTNGFKVFREEANGDKDSIRQKEYVYNNDDIRGKMLISINTDNPTISHKASHCESFAYPLSEEFIWLSGMINSEKQIPLSRLEVLSLIYNGFVSMFAPEQAKKSIISQADQEVLSILAAEYLDIGKV